MKNSNSNITHWLTEWMDGWMHEWIVSCFDKYRAAPSSFFSSKKKNKNNNNNMIYLSMCSKLRAFYTTNWQRELGYQKMAKENRTSNEKVSFMKTYLYMLCTWSKKKFIFLLIIHILGTIPSKFILITYRKLCFYIPLVYPSTPKY